MKSFHDAGETDNPAADSLRFDHIVMKPEKESCWRLKVGGASAAYI